ncbi:MAG: DUF6106 family protein [Acutalibacteraceae bacterium]|nr:DUF6106 family protein [Acutalibacteraceae bacterium]
MDTFYEQIIKIKMNGKAKAMIAAIIIVDLFVVLGLLWLSLFTAPAIAFLVIVGAVWGGYKLITMLSVEFEYIFTNGDLDVDKITARSSRKRMVSINCGKVEKMGEFKGQPAPGSVKETFVYCNPDDEGQIYLIAKDRNRGQIMLVIAPDERIREAIEKAVPRLAKY